MWNTETETEKYVVYGWPFTLFVCGLYQEIIVIDKINEHFESTCFSSVARHQLDWKVIMFLLIFEYLWAFVREIVSKTPFLKKLWWTLECTFYFSTVQIFKY